MRAGAPVTTEELPSDSIEDRTLRTRAVNEATRARRLRAASDPATNGVLCATHCMHMASTRQS
jgi:hypothetical protein